MSTTLIVVASATPATILGALAALVPALVIRRRADNDLIEANVAMAKAEELLTEYDRNRNKPWYWPTGPAIKAAPAEYEGEVLHVEHATGPLPVVAPRCCEGHDGDEPCDPATYAVPCCGDCPDWAARTRALSDQPEHDDEDAPHEDTDRPRWWASVVAFEVLAPLAFARRQLPVLVEWLAYRLKSQDQRDAEFSETYQRALEQARDAEYAGRRRCEQEAPVNPSYKSRHVHPDFATGAYQVINPSIPAQRSGDADE